VKRIIFSPARKKNFCCGRLNYWLLLCLLFIPVSCSAQKNILKNISTAKRHDNKGYVVRFHMGQRVSSFNFSQPGPYLLQLELHGENIDSTGIKLYDHHNIIKNITYTPLQTGLGITLYLAKGQFYKAAAYRDGASSDLLVGLTKTTRKKLAAYIKTMKLFAWSKIPRGDLSFGQPQIHTRAIDTTFQKLRRKSKFDTVVLDAGHGGFDTGAIGWHHTLEKNVNLAITLKVGHYINEYMPHVKVVYTRKTDKFIGLKERGRIANRANGDLFVCIHANASRDRDVHGTETWFLGLERSKTALEVMERENNVVIPGKADPDRKISKQQLMIYELANSGNIRNSQKLASMIQHQFKYRAKRVSRGVKQARFVVLYHASMPAVLVETGFVTNPKECKFLTSNYGQSIIASAIFRAIRTYKEQVDSSLHFNASSQ
jgi:N-acetylmuramoyl-L-alanine amidase